MTQPQGRIGTRQQPILVHSIPYTACVVGTRSVVCLIFFRCNLCWLCFPFFWRHHPMLPCYPSLCLCVVFRGWKSIHCGQKQILVLVQVTLIDWLHFVFLCVGKCPFWGILFPSPSNRCWRFIPNSGVFTWDIYQALFKLSWKECKAGFLCWAVLTGTVK